jgi:hypothetical protein
MDQLPSTGFNEIHVDLTLLSEREFNRALDHTNDPETGLALLSKRSPPGKETPERTLSYTFWLGQFTYWRDWLAGDALAVAGAQMLCTLSKRPPPAWLCRAVHLLCMSDDKKRACRAMERHALRYQAVELVRRQGKICGDEIFEEAAKRVAGTNAAGDAETVRKSHQLIRHAGDDYGVTLQNYQREIERRNRRRRRKKFKVDSSKQPTPG